MAIKLTREENLEILNLQLRAENIAGKMQLLQTQLQMLLKEKEDIEKEMRESAKNLSTKYQFDPMRVKIEPDGTILSAVPGYVPGPPPAPVRHEQPVEAMPADPQDAG